MCNFTSFDLISSVKKIYYYSESFMYPPGDQWGLGQQNTFNQMPAPQMDPAIMQSQHQFCELVKCFIAKR